MRQIPEIILIAAIARNGIIGVNGDLPWRLPEDLAFFKSMTLGKPILMGRRTWESLPKPLAGRTHIVLSATLPQTAVLKRDGKVVRTLDQAEAALAESALAMKSREAVIIGGGVLYAQWIDRADRLYLTHVDAEPNGDTWFPEFDKSVWEVETLKSVLPKTECPGFEIVCYTSQRSKRS